MIPLSLSRLGGMPQGAHRHAVVIASGGLDSTVLAYWLAHMHTRLTLVTFNYGQRHQVELDYAAEVADDLGAAHHIVDLSGLSPLLSGSALTDRSVDVPDGHYTDASMAATVVPNRNAIMINIAAGVAVSAKADAVAFGAHAGDHPVYPDCRPEFLDAVTGCVTIANRGFLVEGFTITAPFIALSKADIVAVGAEIGVPMGRTWSCYRGGDVHCGTCGTCVERREAFDLTGVADPTVYAPGEAS